MSAAVALGNPVDSCKRILGFDTGTEPAYGGPPIPLAVYGGPPPTVPTVLPVPPPSDGGADASDAAPADAGAPARVDAGVRTIPKPAYGGPPPKH